MARGGVSFTPSSAVDERMLVSFLGRLVTRCEGQGSQPILSAHSEAAS